MLKQIPPPPPNPPKEPPPPSSTALHLILHACYHSYLAATLRGITTVTLVHCS